MTGLCHLRRKPLHCEIQPLLSDEHFSVDGTLIRARTSMKSFQPKQRAPPSDDDPDNPPPPSPDDMPSNSDLPQTPESPAL